eukprot:742688-Amphidinium_carterae.1
MSGVRSSLPSLDAIGLEERMATHDSIAACLWPDSLDSQSPSLRILDARVTKGCTPRAPSDEAGPGGTSAVEAGPPSEAARNKQRSTSGDTILTGAAGGVRKIPRTVAATDWTPK